MRWDEKGARGETEREGKKRERERERERERGDRLTDTDTMDDTHTQNEIYSKCLKIEGETDRQADRQT